ncbi:MAG TPA: penicillin-binding protein 1A [Caulobacteraceae bacterium]|nr:penicillin-binding protein 1A [Caulobacteraceae bacterium]
MKPLETWVRTLGVAALILIGVAGLATTIFTAWLFHDMPDAGELADYRAPTATRAYAWDGTLIGEFSTERRIFVPYDQMPPHLIRAFLASEDKNFFQHAGVDPGGISRAMLKNVLNVLQGRRLEGGSTITQQVAKNILLTSDATIGRKLKEGILAGQLEQTLSKEQILELYLNEIWLGYQSYGVGAAAYNYFGKSISNLTVEEAAYLAALPKGPQNYHPIRRKRAAIARRNWVIDEMADLGWLSRRVAERAKNTDLKVQPGPQRSKYRDADFFVEEVRRRGLDELGPRLTEGGYYMRTTLDPRLQTAARVALMNGLEQYDRRHGWRGAWARVSEIAPGWEQAALAKSPPAERRAWRAAVVESASGGSVRVLPAKDYDPGNLVGEDVAWANRGKGLKVGDLVFVEPAESGGGYRLRQVPQVNGALVAMDPYTGRVLAMVGGYSFSLSKFNRATQAKRQPGSAFKPFVYATALENGYTPASYVTDARITLPGAGGQAWSPENYNRRYYGPMPIRRGLELSRNAMTVRLALGVGMRKISDMAERAGITPKMDRVLSMALGSGETTPFQLTAAYTAFVNGGRRPEPHLIEMVQDRDGEVIYRADDRPCPRCRASFGGEESPRLQPNGKEIMDPIVAYQITSMLEGVVQRGTAVRARVLERPTAGKTGTTNEYRSAWFIGYTPQIVTGVFIGFDDNRSLGEGETGSAAALPVFIEFMQEATKGTPPTPFKEPKNARWGVVNGVREAFRPGDAPQQTAPREPGVAGPARRPAAPAPGPVQPPAPPPPKIPEDFMGIY